VTTKICLVCFSSEARLVQRTEPIFRWRM